MVTGLLRFAPGQFFGGATLACSGHGVSVSHRIADCDSDAVLTHIHQDAHFILVTGGKYVSTAGSGPKERPSALIYNPPGTTHRDHFEHGRGSFFAISFEPDTAEAALADTCAPTTSIRLGLAVQYALVARIARCCARHGIDLSVQSLGLELLGSMARRTQPDPKAAPAWLHRAFEFLNDRYADSLNISEIARAVDVHPIHLARTFRRHFRCTPGEFQRFRRLESAAGLLARTSWPLAEVALHSGFADQSHFSKGFTSAFGLPPGEYRRLAGRDTNELTRVSN
jgi:AraC family transcriptional regulator